MDKNMLKKRLKTSFSAVFEDLPEDAIESACTENISGWDSMQTWNLLMVVQEEFSITIGLDQISKLKSFSAFEAYVERKV